MDSTSIMYDSSAWTPASEFVQGCMHQHDRPYAVQTFRSTSSSEKVIFVGAHFPHSASNGNLKRAVEAETHWTGELTLRKGLGLPGDDEKPPAIASWLHLTIVAITHLELRVREVQLDPNILPKAKPG